MINENFKKEWQVYGGSISVIDTEHFSFAIDKEWVSFDIGFSWVKRTFHVQILCLVFDFYWWYNYRMKKEITVKLEYEFDEQDFDGTKTDEFIKQDLETEINCCCNSYDIVGIDIKDV